MKNDTETGTASRGVQCRLTLPDGTVVEWVMSGPLVTMPGKATKKNRGGKA